MNELRWTWDKTDKQMCDELDAMNTSEYTLFIECHKMNPPLVYRRCKATPTQDQADLVFALSGGQTSVRSFTGQTTSACRKSYYLGWNTMGFGFDMPSCYCQFCGYGLTEIARANLVIVNRHAKFSKAYIDELLLKCLRTEIDFEFRDIEEDRDGE